jgi:HSP20 family protein
MEVRFENGWNGHNWMADRMNGWLREVNDNTPRHLAPRADVTEDSDAYHFHVEMPGLKSDEIEVRVEDGTLMITAERKRAEYPEGTEVHRTERHYGSIRRAFVLPKDASHDHIHASYTDGVLQLKVEKRPESKPVKIQIN